MNIPQYPVADNRYMTVEEVDEQKHSSCCEENKQLINELTERVDHIEVGEYDDTELRTAISSLTNTVTNQQVIIGDLVYGDADNENKISALTETLNNDYYTKDEVTELDNAVASQIVDVRSELIDKIADINLNKADKSELIGIEGEISSLQTAVTASSTAIGELSTALENKASKQDITDAISNQKFKTINNESILGEGNITVQGGGSTDLSNYYTKAESDERYWSSEAVPNEIKVSDGYSSTVLAGNLIAMQEEGYTEYLNLLDIRKLHNLPTQFKTINNESIIGSGNITVQGGGSTIDAYTKTESDARYLNLSGGTVSGVTTIERSSYQNNPLLKVNNGHLQVGNETQTNYNSFISMRKCASDGDNVNGASFYVNGDGSMAFIHKHYNAQGGGAVNNAILSINYDKAQIAMSGNRTTTATQYYDIITSKEIVDYPTKTQVNGIFTYDASTNTLNITTL